MVTPYLGEVRMFAGTFAPVDWAFCDGQTLSIAGNDALFNLIGTTYGGDGQNTFNLPDLRGRVPIHQGTNPQTGQSYVIGQPAGTETVILTTNQIPTHTHALQATTVAATSGSPSNNLLAQPATAMLYLANPPNVNPSLAGATIDNDGGNQPHNNLQPFLGINFIIALQGVYPVQ